MDQTLFLWLSVVIIFSLGSLAHFLYDLSHENKILGLFTAVNESTWEHIKIAITPTLVWSLVDGYFYGGNPNYFTAKLASLAILAFFIPLVFYSYTRISKNPFSLSTSLLFSPPLSSPSLPSLLSSIYHLFLSFPLIFPPSAPSFSLALI